MYSPDSSKGPVAARPASTAPGLWGQLPTQIYVFQRIVVDQRGHGSLLFRLEELACLVQLLELCSVLGRHYSGPNLPQEALHLDRSASLHGHAESRVSQSNL